MSSANRPKVAFIGTGGTISSLGIHPLELQDYGIHNNRMHAGEIVARFPVVNEIAEVIPVDFKNVPSPEIYFRGMEASWRRCATAWWPSILISPASSSATARRRSRKPPGS